jgi:hypothetical protein
MPKPFSGKIFRWNSTLTSKNNECVSHFCFLILAPYLKTTTMKNNFTFTCFGLVLCLGASHLASGQEMHMEHKANPVHKAYRSTGMDSYILSSSMRSKNGGDAKATTARFTAFLHLGMNLNYDFSRNFGMYTGLNIKNIGFIEKMGDSTIKRRTYTFGIPLGLKIGRLDNGNYLLLGGGLDFPFNYREKGFVNRGDKDKFNEWFSSRTPAVMPYVFVGANLRPGFVFKLQYYPGNFMNPDFTTMQNGVSMQPYKGYDVHLLLLTFGFNFPYHPKEMMEKIKEHKAEKEI